MARRLTSGLLVTIAVAVAGVVLVACGGSSGSNPSSGLAVRKITAGEVAVTVTPTRIDSTGAEFTVAFDTHTGALNVDVAARSAFVVADSPWTDPTWSGDGLGGHHRTGTLRFTAAGPARGVARLTISGLDSPVEASWNLP